ncbi:hypothetical protein GCM10023189_32970 [Nibrella saemangeumensis]|uniref:HEAT repeat domain-containing protein n=1 Tax=Nibrella saemangeumensis TaxID=1084526 RepID=A0ABP8N2K7_9BACT
MTKSQAINFLKQHQPLPPDDYLSKDVSIIQTFDEVRNYFLGNPDKECIPYFLNCFGGDDGLGVYQLIEDVVLKYQASEVIPFLISALQSSNYFIRYWNTQIASLFPDPILLKPLAKILSEDSFDIKSAAIVAIEQVGSKKAKSILEVYREQEQDEELQSLAEEAISSLGG